MSTLDDLVDGLDVHVEFVDMLLNRGLAMQIETAERDLKRAQAAATAAEEAEASQMSKPQLAAARAAVDEAQAALDAAQAKAGSSRVKLHVQALGNRRWKELLWLVPPTDEQRARLGDKLDHNPELFPVVALAFALVDVDDDGRPTGTMVDQAELDALENVLQQAKGHPVKAQEAADELMPPGIVKLNEKLTAGGWDRLTAALYRANLEVSQVPLSLTGSAMTTTS